MESGTKGRISQYTAGVVEKVVQSNGKTPWTFNGHTYNGSWRKCYLLHIANTSENNGENIMSCRRPPRGWICTREADHDGACAAHPTVQAVHFLRRNEHGNLERLVTDGKWTGWVSAERPSRGWVMWKAIARARGI